MGRWRSKGVIYDGGWKANKFDGLGTYTYLSGMSEVSRHVADRPVGVGVRWSADRETAWRLKDGEVQAEISPEEASALEARVSESTESTPPLDCGGSLDVVIPRVHPSSRRS